MGSKWAKRQGMRAEAGFKRDKGPGLLARQSGVSEPGSMGVSQMQPSSRPPSECSALGRVGAESWRSKTTVFIPNFTLCSYLARVRKLTAAWLSISFPSVGLAWPTS